MKSYWQAIKPYIALVMLIAAGFSGHAEGTAEVAPNGNIMIDGNNTSDVAALHIDNPQFNNFASFNNQDVNSRLHIHISDPTQECIYLGFSTGHLNNTSPNPTPQNFEYRILDPSGNVVYGPVAVLSNSAPIQNWQQAVTGPEQLAGSNGYQAEIVSSADLMSQSWATTGDYYIEFRNTSSNDPLLIDYWDITVVDCSGATPDPKAGRIWSYNWALFAINDFGFPNRPFNGAFYVCAPDPVDPESAFITQIDFNGSGFRPAAFNVAFNSFGTMNTGNISMDRRSVENMNMTQPEYAIFLNDPIDICRTAQGGNLDILGISSCDGTDFCIDYISTRAGQIDLLLDFDGDDGIFTPNSADVMITDVVTAEEVREELCLDWDGNNGLGEPVFQSAGTEIPIVLSFAQGIYHFPIYDAELMTEGFEIRAVRPGGNDPLLYYDDSNISVPSGSGEPAVQLAGCDLPCHRWTNYTNPSFVGFGNLNTINSWWFSQQVKSEETFLLPGFYTCSLDGPASVCQGDTIELVAAYEINPDDSFPLDVISRTWFKDGNVAALDTDTLEVTEGGTYDYELVWLGLSGDSCSILCSQDVELLDVQSAVIDTTLILGDTLVVGNSSYFDSGTFVQSFTASNGCDSTITIILDVIDPTYTCSINGMSPICFGDTTVLELVATLDPPDAEPLPIQRIEWSGPGLSGQVTGESIEVWREGTYVAVLNWIGSNGILQFTECSFELDLNPRFAINIDTLITEGDTLDIDGLEITEPGSYEQVFTAQNGCDSIVIINVISQDAIVFYDFDDCRSIAYENFQPDYPDVLICGSYSAGNVYRINPEINGHSCTPGPDGNVAMCISSLDDCSYQAGDDKSLVFELEVIPNPDSVIQITSVNFLERAPEEFQWIVGTTGPNNYPLLYGFRVIKNGVEVFRQDDIATTTDWTREIFSFVGRSAFEVREPSLFQFELLPYCLSGVDSDVTAWDIDDLSIQARCGLDFSNTATVSGQVKTVPGDYFDNLELVLSSTSMDGYVEKAYTNESGIFAFNNVLKGEDYLIKASHDKDVLNGVSTLDLVHIQRHVLGLQQLDDPYKLIAADVNNSGDITAADLLELRKVILGVTSSFPNNESWRFHNTDEMLNSLSPWTMSEIREVDALEQHMPKQNFIAIKTGDVTMDHNPGSEGYKNSGADKPGSTEVVLEELQLKSGAYAKSQLRLKSMDILSGIQFTLGSDKLIFRNVKVLNDNGLIIGSYISDGSLVSIVGYSETGTGRNQDLVLELEFEVLADGLLSDMITFDYDRLVPEAYTGQGSLSMPLGLAFRTAATWEVQSYPNPFSDNVTLSVNSVEERSIKLNLFQADGRLVYSRAIALNKGSNEIVLDKSDLGSYQGMMLCVLTGSGERTVLRLVRI